MTHDELLAYINKEIDQAAWTQEYYPVKSLQALRAVMELHKPEPYEHNEELGLSCSCNQDVLGILNPYPCPTIQAIEKELG
jgi:hypothetical protein